MIETGLNRNAPELELFIFTNGEILAKKLKCTKSKIA
jgi:hypothetical protein